MQQVFSPVAPGSARLLPGEFLQRYELNRRYLLSLRTENLLQSHYMEAGLWNPRHRVTDIHWGWESPTCQIRGTFLGHWLSAAARGYAWHGDTEIKARGDRIVAETGALPGRERRRVGRLDPRRVSRLDRPGQDGLGTPLRAPQEPDGAVRDGHLRRERAGARGGREVGRLVPPLDRGSSAGSRWTTSLTVETGGMLEALGRSVRTDRQAAIPGPYAAATTGRASSTACSPARIR